MATNALEVIEYNRGLKKKIQKLFIAKIVPANFVMLIPKYGTNVLTDSDIARIRKDMTHKIDEDINMDLLDLMTRYDGWFDCLIKCLGDSELKQSYLIPHFEKLKSEFDEEYNGPNRDAHTTEPKLLDEPNGNEIESDFVLPLTREQDTTAVGISGADAVGFSGADAVVELSVPSGNINTVTSTLPNMSLRNSDGQWSFENGRGQCYVCDIELTSEQHKTQHLTGIKHLKKAGQWSNKTTVTRHLEEPKMKDVENDIVLPIKGEQDGAVDVAGADGHSSIPSNNVTKVTITLANLNLNNSDGQWSFENGRGQCNVCDIELTSEQHKTQHLTGQKHLKKAGQWSNQLISQSDICRSPTGIPANDRSSTTQSTIQDHRKNQSFCEICSLALTSPEHAAQHYSGKNHNKRVELEKMKNSTYSQNGNKEFMGVSVVSPDNNKSPIGVSVVSPEHGKNPACASSKPYDLDDNGRGYCNVCGVGLTSKQNAEDHLKGRNHKRKFESWDPSKPM